MPVGDKDDDEESRLKMKQVVWHIGAMKKRAPGCLGYIGDEKLPSSIGIIIKHYKDPYEPTRIQWKVPEGFVSWHIFVGSINSKFVACVFGWICQPNNS